MDLSVTAKSGAFSTCSDGKEKPFKIVASGIILCRFRNFERSFVFSIFADQRNRLAVVSQRPGGSRWALSLAKVFFEFRAGR
jgi:hypothetical protein